MTTARTMVVGTHSSTPTRAPLPNKRHMAAMHAANTDRPWVGQGDTVGFIDASGKTRTGKAIRFQPGFIVCLVRQSDRMVYPRPSYAKVADMALYAVPYNCINDVTRAPAKTMAIQPAVTVPDVVDDTDTVPTDYC